jgi:MFS family permease
MRNPSASQENIQLGLRANWAQFSLLVLINAFVGAMVGLERTVVPLIGEREFGLVSKSAILSFIVSFGFVKAAFNLFSARLSESWGRKRLLVLGWLVGLPIPFIIMAAPHWGWIAFANVLLGINQALTWSMTVIMKIDLVGPKQRGLAMGFNEFAGYLAVGITAFISGYIASLYALRPQPFYLGAAIAFIGLILSLFFAKETLGHAHFEAAQPVVSTAGGNPTAFNNSGSAKPSLKELFILTSWRNKTLFSCSQAGLVNNLNDGMVWGLLPLFLSVKGLGVEAIGLVAAVYPATWGFLQLFTGGLSDHWGRKYMIALGMITQALGIWIFLYGGAMVFWISGCVLLGVGTAMVYPTLLAAISDVAYPTWRATSMGVYRFWRDSGYAFGALLSGIIADLLGLSASISVIAWLTLLSGLLVWRVMKETLQKQRS